MMSRNEKIAVGLGLGVVATAAVAYLLGRRHAVEVHPEPGDVETAVDYGSYLREGRGDRASRAFTVQAGTYRVSFNGQAGGGAENNSFAQIRKNGVSYGVAHPLTTDAQVIEEDLTFAQNDVCEIWVTNTVEYGWANIWRIALKAQKIFGGRLEQFMGD